MKNEPFALPPLPAAAAAPTSVRSHGLESVNSPGVALDRHVRIAPRSTVDFGLLADRFLQPFGQSVIVEIKFTNRFPGWAGQMTRAIGMTRSGAAKYCEGVANFWHPQYIHWQHGLDDE